MTTIPGIDNTAQTQSAGARTTLSDNFDTFLVLLTAQLQNQDPLAPMDLTQFTQQLVQYSQVEQQIRTNEQLESLVSQYNAMSASLPLSYIGRFAVIDSNNTYMANEQAAWTYSFEDTPSTVTINVLDAKGKTVFSTQGVAAPGTHNFVWDGKNDSGEAMPDGIYRLSIVARDPTNTAIASDVNAIELVSGVDLTGTPPKIVSRSGNHDLSTVLGVLDFL
ncbi:MAG: flagellar hook capping protein [Terricaulis sp.]|nr:flagellar hook capping protein [Terricaulis sp.]